MRRTKHLLGALLLTAAGALAQTDQSGTVPVNRLLAAVLVAEAGGEGTTGMKAVGEVVLRRAVKHKQPIEQVLRTPYAFSCLNRKSAEDLVAESESSSAWPNALLVSDTVLHHPSRLPGITKRATHYINPKYAQPKWAKSRTPVAVIGRHAFYRLP